MQICGFYLINLCFFFVCSNCFDLQHCTKVAYHCPWCTNNTLVPITLRSLSANLCHGRTRNYWPTPHDCTQCSELYDISNIVKLVSIFSLVFVSLVCFFGFLTSSISPAKMWGPGAEQEGILQTSSCKLDLKEPYYRMSQPQAYPLAQDQQQHQLISTQVLTNPVITFLSFRYMILVRSLSWNFLSGAGIVPYLYFYHLIRPICPLQYEKWSSWIENFSWKIGSFRFSFYFVVRKRVR